MPASCKEAASLEHGQELRELTSTLLCYRLVLQVVGGSLYCLLELDV